MVCIYNGYEYGLGAISCGVSQGSVLGPLLFLLYINDLNQAITFCKVHHFTDDTNLSLVIMQKGESLNVCFKKAKHAKTSKKEPFLTL